MNNKPKNRKWWEEIFLWWLEPEVERKWSRRELFWCPVDTPGLAKWARGPALTLSCIVAIAFTIFAVVGLFTPNRYGNWLVIYAIYWILVVWGLYKMRPEAAIGGFVVAVIDFFRQVIEGSDYISAGLEVFYNIDICGCHSRDLCLPALCKDWDRLLAWATPIICQVVKKFESYSTGLGGSARGLQL